jgi:hypothetical protein
MPEDYGWPLFVGGVGAGKQDVGERVATAHAQLSSPVGPGVVEGGEP